MTPDRKDKCDLFPHQVFLRRFFGDKQSPYRGIFLYHNLGTGKTITSIAIAEALVASAKSESDVVVLLPAALEQNYIQEILKCGQLDTNKYTFLHYNGINAQKVRELGGPQFFQNKIIVIDEVHNFISYVKNRKPVKQWLYDILYRVPGVKIVALSGTPIINETHEIAFLLNLLRGPLTSYRIEAPFFPREIGQDPQVEVFDVRDSIAYLVPTPPGFVKGDPGLYPEESATHEALLGRIRDAFAKRKIRHVNIQMMQNELLPTDPAKFNALFVNTEQGLLKNEHVLARRAQGLVSFFETEDPAVFPHVSPLHIVSVPLSNHAFEQYKSVRELERLQEQRAQRYRNEDERLSDNVYKSFSRAICLFAFPDDIPRVYPSTLGKILESRGITFASAEASTLERERILRAERERMMAALREQSSKYLRGSGLYTHGPKYLALLQRIEKSPGPILVYSGFRQVEGLGILQLVLQEHGFKPFDVHRPLDPAPHYETLTEDAGRNTYLMNIFNSPENQHGELIRILLISQRGAEGISVKNVRQVHLMEPYWNPIRIQQVIGRASRIASHLDLPPDERQVDVFLYVATLAKGQSIEEDNNRTSDEQVLMIANRKRMLMDRMLVLLKRAAIDCPLYGLGARQGPGVCWADILPFDKDKYAYDFEDIEKDVKQTQKKKLTIKALRSRADPERRIFMIKETGELIDPAAWENEKEIKKLGITFDQMAKANARDAV